LINEVVLVGKIRELNDESEFKKSIFIEIDRPFKDTYERMKDIVECVYWNSIFKSIVSTCKVGDMVAVRGRIENENNKCCVAMEKIVLLNKNKDNVLKVL
jgi:single-stranded DNA-binding protein